MKTASLYMMGSLMFTIGIQPLLRQGVSSLLPRLIRSIPRNSQKMISKRNPTKKRSP